MVENIVKAVQKILKVPDNIEDWSLLRSVSTPDDTFKKLLEKYSSDIKYLSDIFQTEDKVLAKKILKNVLEVSVAFENLGGLSTFWNLLNNNIDCLESNDKLKFFEIFQKQKIGQARIAGIMQLTRCAAWTPAIRASFLSTHFITKGYDCKRTESNCIARWLP